MEMKCTADADCRKIAEDIFGEMGFAPGEDGARAARILIEWFGGRGCLPAQRKEYEDRVREVIETLVNELYSARAALLGITALDTAQERDRKEKDGDCAVVRGIDRTIRYVNEMKETRQI